MSVLIKGTEMPKDGEHPYWAVIHSDGTVEYNENQGQGWQASEAVPVPPHGRLIDADALVRELNSILVSFGSANGLIEGGLSIAVSTVNGMSTIIPAEP